MRLSPYYQPIGKNAKYNAVVKFAMGGCAIFAYALWKKLPDWNVIVYEGAFGHCALQSPDGEMVLDINGLREFDLAAEIHYGDKDWEEQDGPETDENGDYIPQQIKALDLHDEIDFLDFFDSTWHYCSPPIDKKHVEKLIKDRYVSYWANRIIKNAKIESPELFENNFALAT